MGLVFPEAWTGADADIFLDISIDGGTTWAAAQSTYIPGDTYRPILSDQPIGDGQAGTYIDVTTRTKAILQTNPPRGTRPVMRIRTSVVQTADRTIYAVYAG